MSFWFAILAPLYVAALAYATLRARSDTKSDADFLMAGSRVGVILGFLSFSATLFSTFTLLGMPDFFRTHGIGAWVFLGVSDSALAFVLLWFGLSLRRHSREFGFTGVGNLIVERCGSRRLGFLYLGSLFVFIVPYVAVQIRGIGFFLHSVFPELLPFWGWAVLIVIVLLVYSELGGLKAIMYSDALQGVVLLAATWLIAARCIGEFGSVQNLIAQVESIEPALLSTPGPQGLFDTQFLIASFLAMALLPLTQPQLTTRIVVMKDDLSFDRMAIAVCVFSLLVIAPTLPIGFYGAVEFGDASPSEFLTGVLVDRQPGLLAATVLVGLLAAAMSTADSQLFALGTELRALLDAPADLAMRRARQAIVALAMAALALSLVSSDQLVMLARVSFTGTAMLAPTILVCVTSRASVPRWLPASSISAMAIYLASLIGVVSDRVFGLRIELALLLVLAALAVTAMRVGGQAVSRADGAQAP